MKKLFSFVTILSFIGTAWLFGGGKKETPIQGMVRVWGDSLIKIVFVLIAVLCVVGLIKFITTRR